MPEAIHPLRGSLAVRSWSKYQSTVPDWTLCGIHRKLNRKDREPTPATEIAGEVTCRFCRKLMGTSYSAQNAEGRIAQDEKSPTG